MRLLLILVNFVCLLHTLEITINTAVENNKRFSIITLKGDKEFFCKSHINIYNKNTKVECIIDKVPSSNIAINDNDFFKIEYKTNKNRLFLFIKAKKNQELFANFMDLKENAPLIRERPKTSKIWQVVGFEDDIPFLSKNDFNGINFPIQIPISPLPNINELNIDASPLEYSGGIDLNALITLSDLYKEKKYVEGENAANDFLNIHKDSIFTKDALLYKIRFMDKNSNTKNNDVIELAKSWVKQYSSDVNVPEVLYIIGNGYVNSRIYNEATYYYNRIVEEYADSKYAQYALVGIAKNVAINGDKRQPPLLYSKAYQNAKDIDTASYVSIAWGDWALDNEDKNTAHKLYKRVLDLNKKYFLQEPNKSFDEFKKWADEGLYDIAAHGAEYLLDNIDDETLKEDIMFSAGSWYELDSNPNKAHFLNQKFISTFSNSPNINKVKLRDDNLLFHVSENDVNKKIAQYDHIIKTYPNTDNAKIALEKKAQTLFALDKYDEVLKLKDLINKDSIVIKQSYAKLIELSENCNNIIEYYVDSNMTLATNNASQVYQCLFDAKLYVKASQLANLMLKNSMSTNNKLEWLYNSANADYMIQDYNKSVLSSRDAFKISKRLNSKQDIGVTLFLSLAKLDRKEEAITVANDLLSLLKGNKKLIEVYYQLFKWSVESADNIAIEKYAKDVIDLQNKFSVYKYSPFVEISLADVLFNDHRYSAMLDVTKNIFKHNLSNNEAQKIHYINGRAKHELNDIDAREELNKCINIDKNSTFGLLCSEAVELMDNNNA